MLSVLFRFFLNYPWILGISKDMKGFLWTSLYVAFRICFVGSCMSNIGEVMVSMSAICFDIDIAWVGGTSSFSPLRDIFSKLLIFLYHGEYCLWIPQSI